MARAKYKVKDMNNLSDGTNAESQEPQGDPFYTDVQSEGTVEGTQTQTEAIAQKRHKGQTGRSQRYLKVHQKVDRTKLYSLTEAIELLKAIKTTKFDESVDAHLLLKEVTSSIDVAFPHSTGKKVNVRILDDETIASLEKGIIDFDMLLATPAQMGKVTKFARLLGPKGLMPNPKNGTLISDPAKRKEQLEGGTVTLRGEKKAPLLHVTLGKISMETKALEQNVQTLLSAIGQGKALKMTLCSTMSPGVKIQL